MDASQRRISNLRWYALSGFAALGTLFNVQRPQWKNVEGTSGQEAMPRAEVRRSRLASRAKKLSETLKATS